MQITRKPSHQNLIDLEKIDPMASMVKKSKLAVVDQISPELFPLAIGAAPIEYSGVGLLKLRSAAVVRGVPDFWFCSQMLRL